jgi:hypothetical protein
MADKIRRPTSENCENCKWWKQFNVKHTGQCRRNPPGNGEGPSPTGVDWHGSIWPHTRAIDWCGEFAERPAK